MKAKEFKFKDSNSMGYIVYPDNVTTIGVNGTSLVINGFYYILIDDASAKETYDKLYKAITESKKEKTYYIDAALANFKEDLIFSISKELKPKIVANKTPETPLDPNRDIEKQLITFKEDILRVLLESHQPAEPIKKSTAEESSINIKDSSVTIQNK